MNTPFSAVSRWSTPDPARLSAGLPGPPAPLSSVALSTPRMSEPPAMTTESLNSVRSQTPYIEPGSLSPLENEEYDITTLRDPRSHAMSPANEGAVFGSPKADLDDEVAALSAKLINAVNRQTSLDDSLSSTRNELEQSRDKVSQLELQLAQQREILQGDVWVRRKTVEAEKAKLLSRVAEEKRLREDAEEQKRGIELELENLTAALFEEANKMVVSAKEAARDEHEALQRKIDQLRAQRADAEGLLTSQQEQLSELKQVMEQMTAESDIQTANTVPSSPGLSKFDARDEDGRSDGHSQSGIMEPLSPSYPTSFTHLLQPVLRTDLASYHDFRDLVRTSKRFSAHRRSAGSQNGTGTFGLGLVPSPANGSTTSLSNSSHATVQTSPQIPGAFALSPNIGSAASGNHALKDTRFYKRALAEDIEPTLRLDIAPGVSWLARRAVLNAMTDGSLVVEPVPANTVMTRIAKPQNYPCTLCGESRQDDEHLRHHRFRTSELESAQRYPLCKYCLGRIRSTCDFIGFLRIVKDGHWRADDDDAEKAAWEESVRLREQMFWSRIGGGVVPTGSAPHRSMSSPMGSPRAGEANATGSDQSEGHNIDAIVSKTAPVTHQITPGNLPGTSDLGLGTDTNSSVVEPPHTPDENSRATLGEAVSSDVSPEHDAIEHSSFTIPGSFDD